MRNPADRGNDMKKIAKFLFGRLFITGMAILLQMAWIIYFLYDVSEKYNIVNIFMKVMMVIMALFVMVKPSNPSSKLAWTFFILVFPIVGIAIYFVFGRSNLTKGTRVKMDQVNAGFVPHLVQDQQMVQKIKNQSESVALQTEYIRNSSGFPVYGNTTTDYYKSGEELFAQMLTDIENAKHFIFLEYFIFQTGKMYNTLVDLLEKKAKEGVEVRLIYDDFGCVTKMPSHFYRDLQKRGIHCASFNPFRPVLSIIMNNRDHRKILVIDGKIGYTGGINIADEYINEIAPYGYWKDTGIRLEGDAVWNFTVMFLQMWDYIVRDKEEFHNVKNFMPDTYRQETPPNDGFVQPYGDTPLDDENVGENVYLNMINRAKRYIYIFTPYLILDQEFSVSLGNAAKSGVDVRIVTPGIPDKKLVYLLTRSNYQPLIENGVKIYEYTPGFIHAKCFVCDDEIATVGSINLDYRSLYMHFECGVWLYQSKAVFQVKEDMIDTIKQSELIPQERFSPKKSYLLDLLRGILSLLAPLV